MLCIDYSKSGAQEFIDSWVSLFASYGIDYLSVTAQWPSLGLSGAATVRDVWAHKDLGAFSGAYAATLASHASALLRITP